MATGDNNGFSTLADIVAAEAIPLENRDIPTSTYELIERSARNWGDKTALSYLPGHSLSEEIPTLTYNEFFARITQTANAFHGLGVGAGDAVGILLPNCLEYMLALWGGEASGIATPINLLLDSGHIADILNEIEAKILVTLAPLPGSDVFDKAMDLRAKVPTLETVVTVDLANYLPPEQRREVQATRADYLDNSVADFDAILAGEPGDRLCSGRIIHSDDIASYFHTGGSTGTPKIAPHTHGNECVNAVMLAMSAGFSDSDVGLCGLPLFHVNGTMVTGLAPFLTGASVIIATSQGFRSPLVMENFWELTEKHQLTYFSGVPTIYSDLLKYPIGGRDLSSLRISVCGGAPMPVDVITEFEAKTDIVILEGYGMTEGTAGSFCNPLLGERRIGSVGLRQPYQQYRIAQVDEASGTASDCGVDEVGHILIKGPNVFHGYKQEDRNKGLWIDDGWFDTGDLGRVDADGYLWLTGRSKDLIIRGGHNIDPGVIEEALHKHPSVHLAAAVGKPDPRVGELPVSYVQLRPEATCSEQELLAFCAEHIAERAAIPKDIYLVDEMPLTGVGKIFKPALRQDAICRAYTAALAPLSASGLECRVEVHADDRYGQLATIHLSSPPDQNVEHEIAALLKGYSTLYEITA